MGLEVRVLWATKIWHGASGVLSLEAIKITPHLPGVEGTNIIYWSWWPLPQDPVLFKAYIP